MLTYPITPIPSFTQPTTQAFKTLTYEFDSGAEQRRGLLRFSKRDFSLSYKNLQLSERDTLHDFYRNVGGSRDAFWFVDFISRRWVDEYVGRSVIYGMSGAVAQDDASIHSLLHFNGISGSTTMYDEYGHPWTAYGTAKLHSGWQILGSACLWLDGNSDYIKSTYWTSLGSGSWTIEGWFWFSLLTPYQNIFSFVNASGYGINLRFDAGAQKLSLSISSNGTSWNVADESLGTKSSWKVGKWYKFAVVYTESAYKVYIGEAGSTTTLDISVSSSSDVCGSLTFYIGSKQGADEYFWGRMDEIRISVGMIRYTTTFIPETEELPFDAGMTDETDESNDETTNDMTLLPSTPAEGDAYYFGNAYFLPDDIILYISTAGSGTWTLTWEYWNGSAWSALSNVVDGTNGFKPSSAGPYEVTFDQVYDYEAKEIKGIWAYWIRARVSSYTSKTTSPKGAYCFTSRRYYELHVKSSSLTELISNGDMELQNPPASWLVINTPELFERSSSEKHGGAYSGHVNDSTPSYGGFHQHFSATQYKTYRIRFWYYIVSGSLYGITYAGDNATMVNGRILTVTGSWKYCEFHHYEPIGGANASIAFVNASASTAAEFYIDDVSVQECPYTVYVNGNAFQDYMIFLGEGEAGVEVIRFDNAQENGALITSDLTGNLRIKGRLFDDNFSEELIAPSIFNIGLKVREIQW